MRILIFLVAFSLLASISAYNWEPTDAYAIKFSTAKVEGSFTDLKGTIDFDAKDLPNANFDVSVATASINTGNKTKDKHAVGESWLGERKAVSIPFTFDNNVFSGELTVNRHEFGIDGPFLFGGLVGDDVKVSLRIPVE